MYIEFGIAKELAYRLRGLSLSIYNKLGWATVLLSGFWGNIEPRLFLQHLDLVTSDDHNLVPSKASCLQSPLTSPLSPEGWEPLLERDTALPTL